MRNSPKKKPISVKTGLKNIIFETIGNMQNGSITIVKQDNMVIQINVNEKISLV